MFCHKFFLSGFFPLLIGKIEIIRGSCFPFVLVFCQCESISVNNVLQFILLKTARLRLSRLQNKCNAAAAMGVGGVGEGT